MSYEIETKTITAKTRKLSATWTINSIKMMRPIFGVGEKRIPLKPTYKGKKRNFQGRNKWLNSHFTGKYNREALRIRETIRKENELVSIMANETRKEIDNEIIQQLKTIGN